MKVVLITGSLPPDVCGTAEYTLQLSESLRKLGVDARIVHKKHWGLAVASSLLRELRGLKPDLLHIQYPTTGYGYGLAPQGIATIWPSIVTVHEASQAHLLRKMSLYPFLLRGLRFVFTNEFERSYVTGIAPWIAGRSVTIPIGGNIPVTKGRSKCAGVVTCFSIIRKGKGLEDVIELARLLQQRRVAVRIRIVGALMPRWSDYYNYLRDQTVTYPIDWMVGFDNHALSNVLGEATLVYLPFPDGASERRSSLITMLMNETCVLTTIGPHTPADFTNYMIPVKSPLEAADRVEMLLDNEGEQRRFAELGAAFSQRFDWNTIALRHREMYESCLV